MDEQRAERIVIRWLEDQGYDVKRARARSGPRNLAASGPRGQLWIVQVRGEQRAERLNRQEWFAGVGQIACTMTEESARYSLAVPQGFRKIVEESLPALQRTLRGNFSALLVRPTAVQEMGAKKGSTRASRRQPALSQSRSGRQRKAQSQTGTHPMPKQGHPDGTFTLKGYRYKVDRGKVAVVKHPYGEPLPIRSFAGLARELRIKVGGESASRIINRARRASEGP